VDALYTQIKLCITNKLTTIQKKRTLANSMVQSHIEQLEQIESGWVLDGTYKLTKALGCGGQADVFKATGQEPGKEYAIKVLLSQSRAQMLNLT